jgi:hypothetical protein
MGHLEFPGYLLAFPEKDYFFVKTVIEEYMW